MKVFITDLNTICNWDDLVNKLPGPDLTKYKSFRREIRAKQFLVAHNIQNQIQNIFKHTSIAHKDNIVIVAASNGPIGVDIEDASVPRDFETISEFMNFHNVKNSSDFYRAFTLYEAKYKTSVPGPLHERFYKIGTYMICIISNETLTAPEWANPELIPEQI